MDAGDVLVTILLVLGGVFVVTTAAVATGVWFLARRVRRSRALRRGIDRGRVGARAVLADRAGRRAARLELDVARTREATHRALGAARDRDRPVGELPQIAARLDDAADGLLERLRVVSAEPDRALRERLVAEVEAEVAEFRRVSTGVREAALGEASTGRALERAAAHLEIEGEALRAWDAPHGGPAADGVPGPARTADGLAHGLPGAARTADGT